MRKHKLAIAIGLCSTALAGCGSDSDDTTTGDSVITPEAVVETVTETETVTYQATAIDGYLENAIVWLDTTPNYKWDEGEPKASSDTAGVATLDVTGIDNPENYRVVVQAIANETVDIGNDPENPENNIVDSSYMMTAPEGETSITPLSTLVQNYIEQSDSTDKTQKELVEEATSQVASVLGLEEDEILGDFIEEGNDTAAATATVIVEYEILPADEDDLAVAMGAADDEEDNESSEGDSSEGDSDEGDSSENEPEEQSVLIGSLTAAADDIQTDSQLVASDPDALETVSEKIASADKDDTDGDGYKNYLDAYPNDPNEWADSDGDGLDSNGAPLDNSATGGSGYGNNSDTDDDNDGYEDDNDEYPVDAAQAGDHDGDGIDSIDDAQWENPAVAGDFDGDGVDYVDDLFRNDGKNWSDDDSDGLGDQTEEYPNDHDNDGFETDSDSDDDNAAVAGDHDGDGVDSIDDVEWENPAVAGDFDGDGVDYVDDLFRNDGDNWSDDDNDGLGDQTETYPNDHDNDGFETNNDSNDEDASIAGDHDEDGYDSIDDEFPYDDSQAGDHDGDGYDSIDDAYPDDATRSGDLDGDGYDNLIDQYPNDASKAGDLDGDGADDITQTEVPNIDNPDDASVAVEIMQASGSMYAYWAEDNRLYQVEFSANNDTFTSVGEKRVMNDGTLSELQNDEFGEDLFLTNNGWVEESNIIVDLAADTLVGYRVALINGVEVNIVDQPLTITTHVEDQNGDNITESIDIDFDDEESKETITFKDDSARFSEGGYRVDISTSSQSDTYWLWDWTPEISFADSSSETEEFVITSLDDLTSDVPLIEEVNNTVMGTDNPTMVYLLGNTPTQFVINEQSTGGTAYHYYFDWNNNSVTLIATSDWEYKTVYGTKLIELPVSSELITALEPYGYDDDEEEIRILSLYEEEVHVGEKELADQSDDGMYLYNATAQMDIIAQVQTPVTFDETEGVNSSDEFVAMVNSYVTANDMTLPLFDNLYENFEHFFQFNTYNEESGTNYIFTFSKDNKAKYGDDWDNLNSASWSLTSIDANQDDNIDYDLLSVTDNDSIIAQFVLFQDENNAGNSEIDFTSEWYDIQFAYYNAQTGEVSEQKNGVGFYYGGWNDANTLSDCYVEWSDDYSETDFLTNAASCVSENNPPTFTELLTFDGDTTSISTTEGNYYYDNETESNTFYAWGGTYTFNSDGSGYTTWHDSDSNTSWEDHFTWQTSVNTDTGISILTYVLNTNPNSTYDLVITDTLADDTGTYYATLKYNEWHQTAPDGNPDSGTSIFTSTHKLEEYPLNSDK